MAYADQGAGGSRFTSILLVVLIHIGIGAALIIGLGYEGVKEAVKVVTTFDVPEEPEEPEEEPPPPPEEPVEAPPPPPVQAPPPPIKPPTTNQTVVQQVTDKFCPGYGGKKFALDATCPEPPPQTKTCDNGQQVPINQACPKPEPKVPPTSASPKNNPGGWIRTSDYERSWLDRELQGSVGFSVTVGANGRVQGCSITASSGSSELDNATCKYVTSRARFKPATQNGQPVTGSYANRVVWRIP